jgi:hypothetical protein
VQVALFVLWVLVILELVAMLLLSLVHHLRSAILEVACLSPPVQVP